MKKRFKLFAVVLCLIMVLPTVLASCTGNGTPSVTTDEPGSTESAPDTSTPDTATPDVSPDSSTEDTTDVPPTSDTSDVGGADKPTSTKEVINVKWTMGLVRSDAATRPGYLYKGSCGYSYSEVISIPTAGTEISYTIKNIAKSALPTDQVFVISAWKQDGSKFVFDENGTNLRGTKYASTIVADISPRGGDLYDLKYSYISSKDNENIRLCIPSNHTSDANAPKVDITVTTYKGKGTQAKIDELMGGDTYYENLKGGLHMAVFGDSYLSGNSVYNWRDTYVGYIADKYDMTVTNHSEGGATFARNPASNIVALVDRIERNIGDPDIIIIQGGRNDCTKYSPIGDGKTEDINTVKGAMLYMHRVLSEKHPNAKIIFITAWNSCDHTNKNGLNTGDYANLVTEFCQEKGWMCINAADEEKYGVTINNDIYRLIYSNHANDYSHINPYGNLKVAHAFETRISEMIAGGECDKPFKKVSYKDPEPEGDVVVPENGDELSVKWNFGFVGSDKMSNNQDWTLVPSVKAYRYTDVITIPKAGTTVYFKDMYGVEALTPNTVFLFSSWVKEGNNWVINKNGTNLRSDQTTKREVGGGYVVWEYTTTKDNETIRLCLRGEDDPENIKVFYDLPSGSGTVTPPADVNDIKIVWNRGFVGSDVVSTGQFYEVVSSDKYSYTDVFTVPKAGTKVSFTVVSDVSAPSAVFAVSSWTKSGNSWVIDKTGANFRGTSSTPSLICSVNGSNVTYTYITSKDNENLRLCYRSGQTASSTPTFPKVTFTENAGKGTVTEYNEWLAASKAESYDKALEGISIGFFGDSYLAGHGIAYKDTWLGILGEKYGMTLDCEAIGGSTFSNYVSTNTPMVDRWNNDLGDPDIIIVQGGRNDCTKVIPIGDGETADTKTYLGAIRFMYEHLHKKYPNAKIVFVTAWNSLDHTNALGMTTGDYADKMVEYCKKMGYYCIDASDEETSGVKINDAAFRAEYAQSAGDYSHLNYLGYKKILPFFEAELIRIMNDTTPQPEAPELPDVPVAPEGIDVNWNSGYINCGASGLGAPGTHGNADIYTYSDVIAIEKAGTTISFADLNRIADNGNYYVFSVWKKDASGNWVFDANGTNVISNNKSYLDGNVWSYTTEEDNIGIRICYCRQYDEEGVYATVEVKYPEA